jgi:hypothetical protein
MINNDFQLMQEAYYTTRNAGYTTMMLRASMYNPDCVIVTRDEKTRDWVEKEWQRVYMDLFANRSWKKRIITKILIFFNILKVPTKRPTFKSLRQNLRGYKGPIFFDNSCFM